MAVLFTSCPSSGSPKDRRDSPREFGFLACGALRMVIRCFVLASPKKAKQLRPRNSFHGVPSCGLETSVRFGS